MADSRGPRLGLDVGATLAKLAGGAPGAAEASFELLPSEDLDAVAHHVGSLEPSLVGLTGGGAARLAEKLAGATSEGLQRVGEFEAWGTGASAILERDPAGPGGNDRYLLVSLGTGTSVLLVDGGKATRVGGTALGGGTVVGLGAALSGADFEDLCALAADGSQAAVDLQVSDIYRPNEIPLAGDLTAANFGKLARKPRLDEHDRSDLAAGVMGLVGENVALVCAGLAAATQVGRVVYGGSTLRHNPRLVSVLTEVTTLCGLKPGFLDHGEFAGALGALILAQATDRAPSHRG